jgi:hypothetical protein
VKACEVLVLPSALFEWLEQYTGTASFYEQPFSRSKCL